MLATKHQVQQWKTSHPNWDLFSAERSLGANENGDDMGPGSCSVAKHLPRMCDALGSV